MTEAEWLACDEPKDMPKFVRNGADPNRFRFLAVDWGRRIQDFSEDDDREWFNAFARWVDLGGNHPRLVCLEPIYVPLDTPSYRLYWARRFGDAVRADDPMKAAACAGQSAAEEWLSPPQPDRGRTHRGRSAKQRKAADDEQREWRVVQLAHRDNIRRTFCAEFRCVAGNPFRPVTLDPSWLTSTVRVLASQMYESRDFSTMPILADALQDAGCESPEVLTHCRDSPGIHVRGCWLVDLILEKS